MPRREVTERLPDPEQVLNGNIAIDNCTAEDLPEKYLEIVDGFLPLRRERKDEK